MARRETKRTRYRIAKKSMGRTKKINTITFSRGGHIL